MCLITLPCILFHASESSNEFMGTMTTTNSGMLTNSSFKKTFPQPGSTLADRNEQTKPTHGKYQLCLLFFLTA